MTISDEDAMKAHLDWLEERWQRYDIELDENHRLSFTSIKGDYGELGHIEVLKAGAAVMHRRPDGKLCDAHITFDLPETKKVFPHRHGWRVEEWNPLTVSPSLLCMAEGCGDHGFIRGGKWVKA